MLYFCGYLLVNNLKLVKDGSDFLYIYILKGGFKIKEFFEERMLKDMINMDFLE